MRPSPSLKISRNSRFSLRLQSKKKGASKGALFRCGGRRVRAAAPQSNFTRRELELDNWNPSLVVAG
jgi:hypothetical protein